MAFLMPLLSALVYPPDAYPESFLVHATPHPLHPQCMHANRWREHANSPLEPPRHQLHAWKDLAVCFPWHAACMPGTLPAIVGMHRAHVVEGPLWRGTVAVYARIGLGVDLARKVWLQCSSTCTIDP